MESLVKALFESVGKMWYTTLFQFQILLTGLTNLFCYSVTNQCSISLKANVPSYRY